MSKVLSIIVPMYNMEKYISKCLTSVILPEKSDMYEVLIINDGSNDIDKENGGYGSCFNKGKELAQGKYIKLLDSDDFFDNNILPVYLDILSASSFDIVVNDCIKYDDILKQKLGYYKECNIAAGELFNIDIGVMDGIFIHHFAFKKDLLSNCTCPEKTLYTDGFISSCAVSNASSFFYTKLPIYNYRVNREGQSVTPLISRMKYNDYLRVLSYVYNLDVRSEKIRGMKKVFFSNIETTNYLAIRGICSSRICFDNYNEYKKTIKSLKLFMKKNDYSFSNLKGVYIKFCFLLPSWIGYFTSKLLIVAKTKIKCA